MNDLNYQLILILGGAFTALTTALGGIVAALCWFLRQLLTDTIPGMQRTFVQQLNAERSHHRELHTETIARIDRAEERILDSFPGSNLSQD